MKLRVLPAIFALALIASAVAGPGVASADRGEKVDATFTKWVIGPYPNGKVIDMVGVVGGDVGAGTFAGSVSSYVDNGTSYTIHAVYHINGGKKSFVADNIITGLDADPTGSAVITGVVTSEGPLHGAKVHGGFVTLVPCDIPTPGNVDPTNACYKGSLHITR